MPKVEESLLFFNAFPLLAQLTLLGALASVKKVPFFYNYLSKEHQKQLKDFHHYFRSYTSQDLFHSLHQEAGQRSYKVFKGFIDLQHRSALPYPKNLGTCLWQRGSTKVMDLSSPYGTLPAYSPTVLIVPSLLNTTDIFDLKPTYSFAAYLAAQGIKALAVSWGEPEGPEVSFDLKDYLYERLLPLLTYLNQTHKTLFLLGYCMGGLMALTAASLHPSFLKGVGLMAVPWDFSAMPRLPSVWDSFLEKTVEKASDAVQPISSSFIQGYFQLLSWPQVTQKLYQWHDADKRAKEAWLPLERWLYQGYGLSPKVAQHCFEQWYKKNSPYKTQTIIDKALSFDRFDLPVWGVTPLKDKTVPLQAAAPLFNLFKRKETICPPLGHLALFSSRQAQEQVWLPFVEWIKKES